ncbi:amino acid ABC transporter permease [Desulfobacterales bacterium HSG16]|nr:amino acid ABC transporter permease [Desulfobacterales bacterium HSG16]
MKKIKLSRSSRVLVSAAIDITCFILCFGAISWLVARGIENSGYHWQWYRVTKYLFIVEEGVFIPGILISGILITLKIAGISMIFAFFFGLGTAFLRLSDSLIGTFIARLYLEVIRNTPLLIQIFFLYFVISPIIGIGSFASAVIALSLFEGAYISEIFRAGIISVHFGQWEAASSLGMSRYETYRYVILPQAVKRVLPPLTSQAISLIKDSALVSTISIYDLTMRGQEIISETYLTFEIWFIVAGIYLLINLTLSLCVNIMERTLKVET